MHESVGGAHQVLVGVRVERVPRHNFTSGRQRASRPGADEGADAMATFEENGNQGAAEIAGSSGDEDTSGIRRLRQRVHFE